METLELLASVMTGLLHETRAQARQDAYVAHWRAGRLATLRAGG